MNIPRSGVVSSRKVKELVAKVDPTRRQAGMAVSREFHDIRAEELHHLANNTAISSSGEYDYTWLNLFYCVFLHAYVDVHMNICKLSLLFFTYTDRSLRYCTYILQQCVTTEMYILYYHEPSQTYVDSIFHYIHFKSIKTTCITIWTSYDHKHPKPRDCFHVMCGAANDQGANHLQR